MPETETPGYITSLIRHFEDLRDGTHGGSASRKDREAHLRHFSTGAVNLSRQTAGKRSATHMENRQDYFARGSFSLLFFLSAIASSFAIVSGERCSAAA